MEYYISGNYGPDANRTFDFNGIVIFSDAYIGVIPGYRDHQCNITQVRGRREAEACLNCIDLLVLTACH